MDDKNLVPVLEEPKSKVRILGHGRPWWLWGLTAC